MSNLYQSPKSPAWLAPVLAGVPIFPLLYLLVLPTVGHWKNLNPRMRQVFWIFFGLQLLAALWTPDPVLSLICASLRGVFILCLLSAGAYFRRPEALRPLLWGEIITLLIAFGTTYWRHGGEFLHYRLEHPFYISVSLGLVAFIGFFIAARWTELDRKLRFSCLGISLLGLVFTGSRGAMAALLGALLICALIERSRRSWMHFGIATFGIALSNILSRVGLLGGDAFGRVADRGLDLSGRYDIWMDALRAFWAHPLGGVGTYQIGPYLTDLFKPCTLFPPVEPFGPCPVWLEKMNGAWNIAHNVFLHAMAETGTIGTVGWIIFLGYLGWQAWRSKSVFLIGLYVGYMVMNMVDNPTLLPSPHFAELFYVAMATAAYQDLGAKVVKSPTKEVF